MSMVNPPETVPSFTMVLYHLKFSLQYSVLFVIIDERMKICKTCDKEKELNEFWYNPKTKDRLKTSCISCCKEYDKKYYERNKEKRIQEILAYQKLKRKAEKVIKVASKSTGKIP